MPDIFAGIGSRMRRVRVEHGLSQSKASEMFDVSDRTYKFYELEKTNVPLPVATKFCAEFGVNLNWLVYGEVALDTHQSAELAGRAAKAVFEQVEAIGRNVSANEIERFVQFVFQKSLTGDTAPEVEAELFFAAIAPSVESVSNA